MNVSRFASLFLLGASGLGAACVALSCRRESGGSADSKDAAVDARSPGCGASPSARPAVCDSTSAGPCSLSVNGVARRYYVVRPADYDPRIAYPLVFAWHYSSSTAEALLPPATNYESAFYGVQPNFTEAIYVAPQGLPLTDGGTDYAWANTGGEDVAFSRAMVARIESGLCVDETRVFATGISYGGAMANVLGCEAPDVFRAIGVMSGWLYLANGQKCRPGAVRAWITHGTADTAANISGDETARDQFLEENGCDAAHTRSVRLDENTVCTVYDACATVGEPVVWCPVVGGDHVIQSWAGAAIASFFQGVVSGMPTDAGTGLAPADGGIASDASGAGDATTPPPPLTVTNGAAMAGPWTGSVETFVTANASAGTTIMPACFGGACSPPLAATPCASGTVGVDPTYSTVAGITFDFEGADGGPTTVAMSGTGLTIAFSNPAGSGLRVEFVDSSGAFWCHDVGRVSPVTIPLASFNTQCWTNSGQAFVPGSQVAAIQIIAPSSAGGNTPFNFCFSGVGAE